MKTALVYSNLPVPLSLLPNPYLVTRPSMLQLEASRWLTMRKLNLEQSLNIGF